MSYVTRIGRFSVLDSMFRPKTLSDGSLGFTYEELGHIERRAVIRLFIDLDQIEVDVLKFARKVLGLSQGELAEKLGVTTETVCRWEIGNETFKRPTQLAVLRLLRAAERSAWRRAYAGCYPSYVEAVRV